MVLSQSKSKSYKESDFYLPSTVILGRVVQLQIDLYTPNRPHPCFN